MGPIAAVALVIVLAGCLGLVRLSLRPPRCSACRIAGELLPVQHVESGIPVIETVYWCPRCARVISRRLVTPLWEW